jgi:hypothetical protein
LAASLIDREGGDDRVARRKRRRWGGPVSALPYLKLIKDKITTPEDAVARVKPGQSVFIGTACATPITLVSALEARKPAPPDVELIYFLTSGLGHIWGSGKTAYRHRCFFVGSDTRALVAAGKAEFVPISLTKISEMTANGRVRPDVALIQVSPPDAHGYVSLGISVDIAPGVLRQTETVVAEMNPNSLGRWATVSCRSKGLRPLCLSMRPLANISTLRTMRSRAASRNMSWRSSTTARPSRSISGAFATRRFVTFTTGRSWASIPTSSRARCSS